MGYRTTTKRRKLWSARANAKKAENRRGNSARPTPKIDYDLRITVERSGTGEKAVFECTQGDRIDNYCVYCNGKYQGIQSITTITTGIRKALPSFQRATLV